MQRHWISLEMSLAVLSDCVTTSGKGRQERCVTDLPSQGPHDLNCTCCFGELCTLLPNTVSFFTVAEPNKDP